jgi:hypothetical protein
MSYTKYTKELLQPIVVNSQSVRQVILSLGLKYTGGNYSNISKVIKKLNLDTSHFLGQGWNRGRTGTYKRPIEDYLSNEHYIHSDKLKKRLIKENYFNYKCYKCNRKTWLGQLIPLELHHKDCNHSNNSLNNLEILCANCHSVIHRLK